jgi:hypothetical protein
MHYLDDLGINCNLLPLRHGSNQGATSGAQV